MGPVHSRYHGHSVKPPIVFMCRFVWYDRCRLRQYVQPGGWHLTSFNPKAQRTWAVRCHEWLSNDKISLPRNDRDVFSRMRAVRLNGVQPSTLTRAKN